MRSPPGPLIGGAFARTNYRWLFYINIPLTAIIIAIVALFMNLKVPPGTMEEKLGRMDWYLL
jgi:MFS family permease